jgi:uracil-DNA glycosylase
MDVKIEESWKKVLKDEFSKQYFQELTQFVRGEYSSKVVYPPPKQIFNAFTHCSFEDVRVVILGQDPYHNPNQANGLAFSVADDMAVPPSLQNIYKELHSDIEAEGKQEWLQYPSASDRTGDLTSWAEQGVLLLNATLTVEKNSPGSHQNKGWEEFTDRVIELVDSEKRGVVFLLWGKYARNKADFVDRDKHLVLESPHPSPFSANRGFFGCKHFSKTNYYLIGRGDEPVIW